jgi:Glu-tRNA(Gln) amidotransferase subunit E-like FAD-binding protein
MLHDLNRRLDELGAFIESVTEKAERNMPHLAPPCPNHLHRRREIERQVAESLFSVNLGEAFESVPRTYIGPAFVRQLLEAETPEEIRQEIVETRRMLTVRKPKSTISPKPSQ